MRFVLKKSDSKILDLDVILRRYSFIEKDDHYIIIAKARAHTVNEGVMGKARVIEVENGDVFVIYEKDKRWEYWPRVRT